MHHTRTLGHALWELGRKEGFAPRLRCAGSLPGLLAAARQAVDEDGAGSVNGRVGFGTGTED